MQRMEQNEIGKMHLVRTDFEKDGTKKPDHPISDDFKRIQVKFNSRKKSSEISSTNQKPPE